MEREIEAIDIVAKVIDRLVYKGRIVEFTLSNGIVLAVKSVPPLLIEGVTKEFKAPDPPMVWVEDLGRNEPNPDDPAYLKSITELVEKQNTAIKDMVFATATSVKHIPEGYYGPDDKGWEAKVEFATSIVGKTLEIPSEGVRRYLCWLKFYALETPEDVLVVDNLPTMVGGIREEEIDDIVEFFRSIPRRGADRESTVAIGSQNGNQPNRAARRASSRAGGT